MRARISRRRPAVFRAYFVFVADAFRCFPTRYLDVRCSGVCTVHVLGFHSLWSRLRPSSLLARAVALYSTTSIRSVMSRMCTSRKRSRYRAPSRRRDWVVLVTQSRRVPRRFVALRSVSQNSLWCSPPCTGSRTDLPLAPGTGVALPCICTPSALFTGYFTSTCLCYGLAPLVRHTYAQSCLRFTCFPLLSDVLAHFVHFARSLHCPIA
ncbi:hypothetical protein PLICRDRAFT_525553 [Plicaturopsis crispa FD-325 SS-3]|nr:hypothetical protein PLICRDRAFT_525553 [Plicaturopsis crispa FD-325 SS-3]